MSEIVLVPAWRRPEFLWAALTRIWAARDHDDIVVRVCLDRHHHHDVEWAAKQFNSRVAEGKLEIVNREQHRTRGNSYNVIESYKEALADGFDMIHLVEEDVLVGYDYFDFHRRAHEIVHDAFSVSACRNQNFPLGQDPEPDDEALYLHSSYQSIGVSFMRAVLEYSLAGIGMEYYTNMVAYCKERFPDSAIPAGHAEQDGLLHRQQEHLALPTVYGALPRAYHAGFVGYHRKGSMMAGTIEERARMILGMSADELNARAHSYPDHTTIDLDKERDSVRYVVQWPEG